MPLNRRFLWVPSALLALAVCSPARAQSADSAEDPAADRFVAQGIELRAQGRDSEALRAFQKAAAIDPSSVRVQIHLATVHQALGNWLLADDYLTMALARQNHPYVNRHRPVLEDAKRVIDSNIGRLEVEGDPVGAEVYLNGRKLGTVPLTPARATIGSYTLEIRSAGHYPVRRPIVITGNGLVRESVHLQPMPADDRWRGGGDAGEQRRGTGGIEESGGGSTWLTWTFAGAAGVATAATVGALVFRERHAERWNDDARCLEGSRTRAEVCGEERDKANTAERVAWVGGATAGVFTLGALLSGFGAFGGQGATDEAGLHGCRLGLGEASCFGAF